MTTPAGEITGSRTPSYRALFRAVFEKQFVLYRRYFVNTLGGLAGNYVLFVLMFVGGRTVAPALIDDNLTGIIVGWFVWTMSFSSFQQSAQTLTREATWGTLEQMYMNPLGLFPVVAARIVVQLLFTLATGALMLVALMATTGHWIVIDPITVFPLAFVTMASATGLGFAFGGLALIYKRISSLFLVVQFLLLAAIGTPEATITNALPLSWGTALIIRTMEDGIVIWQLSALDLFGATLVAVGYLGFGYAVFGYSITIAKRRGIMGHY